MTRSTTFRTAAMLLFALPLAAHAEFEGKVSFGYQGTAGNSEATSVNGATELVWNYKRWTHTVNASALGADESGNTTAEAYNFGAKSDFELSDASYLFGRFNWDKDKFSGYDQQTTQTVGYGRKLLDTETQSWNIEFGAGMRQSDLRDGTSEDDTIARLATDYTYQFSETSQVATRVGVESGADNTLVQYGIELKSQLIGNLALVASYRVRYNSDVPAGSEKRDTFTAVSLEYGF